VSTDPARAAATRPVVFSDLDYTIIFDSVLDPRTAALIEAVRERARFVVVTARSLEECRPLPPIPNDGFVAENGAAVYVRHNSHEVLDMAWDRLMAQRQSALDAYKRRLAAHGWRIHHKLRAFSSGVERSGKSEADVAWALEGLPPGLQLQFSRNTAGSYLEVFPQEAGKDKAVHRVCEDLGVPLSATFGLGDNQNDLDMLRVVGFPLAPGNCHPDVRALVLDRAGFVSPEPGHHGAQVMLEHLLTLLPPAS
jgi:HAD superfamily hydrolase (TIGR01484 family)